MSPTWTLWTTRNAVSARSSSSHSMREADVVHPGAAVRLGDRRAEEARARPSSRRPRGGPRPSRPTRGCRAGSRPRRRRGRCRGRAGSRRSGRSRPSADRSRRLGPRRRPMPTGRRSPSADDDSAPMDAARRPPLAGPRPLFRARRGATASGHRLYDTAGKAYLDFANGIAVTALGHVHPRVTAAIHAQVDRLIGPINALGFSEPISRLATDARGDVPGPARHGHVPELGLRGDRRRAQARAPRHRPARDHRVPRRLPRPDVRRAQRHDLEHQLPDRLRAAAARSSTSRRSRRSIATSAATRRRRPSRASAACARCSRR